MTLETLARGNYRPLSLRHGTMMMMMMVTTTILYIIIPERMFS